MSIYIDIYININIYLYKYKYLYLYKYIYIVCRVPLSELTVHVVGDGPRHGGRGVGGARLRRRGHGVVHDDQHVAAALVGVGVRRQRAGLQLAAQGDLAVHTHTNTHTHTQRERQGVSTTEDEAPGTAKGNNGGPT